MLSPFMAAIDHGQRGTICKSVDQQMWRPEWGGWRARPYEVGVGGAQSAGANGGDPPPPQFIVQFVKPDPSIRPIRPNEGPLMRFGTGRDGATAPATSAHRAAVNQDY